jgi:hypothetical protein
MKTNKSSNTRFTGDWEVGVVKRGNSIRRKVVTKGIRKSPCCVDLEDVQRNLREGNEVRLTFANDCGNEIDCVRLIPMMKTDFSGMYVCAQAMGELCDSLKGIKTKLIRREQAGKHEPRVISQTEAKSLWIEKNARRRDAEREKREWVSPDTVVECPKCGYEFRVGRPNND